MEGIVRRVVTHPVPVLLAHVALTIFLGAFALQIRVESTIESMLPARSPEVQYYTSVRKVFGSDDVAVIGVRTDDLFAGPTLEKIARVTRDVEQIDGVERVLSITNAVDPAADVFKPPRLLPRIPPTPAEVRALKKKLNDIPLYGRNLISRDFRGAAINVFFRDLSDTEYLDLGIDRYIQAILHKEAGPEHFYYTGASHLKQVAASLMRRDLLHFTPIAIGLVLLVLWLAFRSVVGVLLPLVSVLLALVWTLGVMVLCGKSITLGTFVLPPLLLVLGSSYGIHVLTRYAASSTDSVDRASRAAHAIGEVWVPVLLSALTTMVGFGALMVNRITAIWDLGLFAVIGFVFLVVTSLLFIPAALQLVPFTPPGAGHAPARLPAFLERVARRSFEFRTWVFAVSLLLVAVALVGARSIRVDSDFLSYFDPDSPARQANEVINSTIVGSNPFSLIVEGTGPGLLTRWDVLKQIKDLQVFLNTLPGITSSISLVDYLQVLEAGLNKGGGGDILVDEQGHIVETPARSFWEDPASLPPVIALVRENPKAFRNVVTQDFGRADILVRTKLSGSRAIERTLRRVRAYIHQHFPAEISVRPTGSLVLLTGTTSDIVSGQVKSLGLALAVIFVVMSLMFLSVRIGLLAILPNAVPVVLFFGVMGWGGIDLNMGTSLIGAIALGLAVDSTVHFMTRLNQELKHTTDQMTALIRTSRGVGVPIVYATVGLFFGFSTFAFSGFVPIQNFGILSAMTMAAALVTNLGLLPALLAGTKIITLWDLVGVKLGEEPTHTIPLFAGLRPAQARIVVLMGRLEKFSPGETIVRRGESGDHMYVILRGNTEVWAGEGAEYRLVTQLHRGNVFGEMALVRHIQRSADVVAADAVELLAIDERFLHRIRFWYPRIASKVFFNLTRILSDRLQQTTEQFVAIH